MSRVSSKVITVIQLDSLDSLPLAPFGSSWVIDLSLNLSRSFLPPPCPHQQNLSISIKEKKATKIEMSSEVQFIDMFARFRGNVHVHAFPNC